jgi:hypothetical protein
MFCNNNSLSMIVHCNICLGSISDKFIDIFCEVKELFGDPDIDVGLRSDEVD